ncbi:FtsB family cell division protein [Alkalithermobacter paradoxus]|uniref:Cell division protein FtsL n=1 Tax=Alkalithermobacter paradoxus TaxID=29349 RepID=A0A1V4I541_9FIRM|nr:cell division protein FtsL [[Clostridium] thermoalcaliphilum]
MAKRKKTNLYEILIVIFIIFLIVYTVWAFINQGIAIRKYKNEIANIKEQIRIIKEEKEKVEEEIENYKQDYYIEKIARERLKMVKPGEIIYIDVNRNNN